MRNYVVMLALLLCSVALIGAKAEAQTSHSVVLSWTDTQNPTGTTYNVYRATGLCSASSSFSKLATAVAVMTYTDSTVSVGSFCYQVTAVSNSIEGGPSNQVNPTVGPFSVTLSVKSVQ